MLREIIRDALTEYIRGNARFLRGHLGTRSSWRLIAANLSDFKTGEGRFLRGFV